MPKKAYSDINKTLANSIKKLKIDVGDNSTATVFRKNAYVPSWAINTKNRR